MESAGTGLDLLVVMDPIESIKPEKDSSFAMMLEAQRRGWRVRYAELGSIWLRDGQAFGDLTDVRVRDDSENWFSVGDRTVASLAEMDVILMRKDPPFDMEYIYATYILERAEDGGALVVNRPQSLRAANEKAFVSWFPECAVPTLISRSLTELDGFIDEHGGAVVKPLDLMAGRSVFVTGPEDPNRRVLLETMSGNGSRYVMAQRYLPEVVESGDARILLIDGEPIPHALVRFAPPGDHRANMSVGARTETRPLTEAEQRICELVGPVLHEMGLVLVGIDVIGSYLTEINVTSPTGIRELDGACDINVAAGLLDAVQSHVDSD